MSAYTVVNGRLIVPQASARLDYTQARGNTTPFGIASAPADYVDLLDSGGFNVTTANDPTIPAAWNALLDQANAAFVTDSTDPVLAPVNYPFVNGGGEPASARAGVTRVGEFDVLWFAYTWLYKVANYGAGTTIATSGQANGNTVWNNDYASHWMGPARTRTFWCVIGPSGRAWSHAKTMDTLGPYNNQRGVFPMAPHCFVSLGSIMPTHGIASFYPGTTSLGTPGSNVVPTLMPYDYSQALQDGSTIYQLIVPTIFETYDLFTGNTSVPSQVAFDTATGALTFPGFNYGDLGSGFPALFITSEGGNIPNIVRNSGDWFAVDPGIDVPLTGFTIGPGSGQPPADRTFYRPAVGTSYSDWPPSIIAGIPDIQWMPGGNQTILPAGKVGFGWQTMGLNPQQALDIEPFSKARGAVQCESKTVTPAPMQTIAGGPFYSAQPDPTGPSVTNAAEYGYSVGSNPNSLAGYTTPQGTMLLQTSPKTQITDTIGDQLPTHYALVPPTGSTIGYVIDISGIEYSPIAGQIMGGFQKPLRIPTMVTNDFPVNQWTIAGHKVWNGPTGLIFFQKRFGR